MAPDRYPDAPEAPEVAGAWTRLGGAAGTAATWSLRLGAATVALSAMAGAVMRSTLSEDAAYRWTIAVVVLGFALMAASPLLKALSRRLPGFDGDDQDLASARRRLRRKYPEYSDEAIDRILGEGR